MNDHPSSDLKGMIAAMSFEDVAEFLSGVADNLTVPACTALTKRLFEIALYDNHVPDEHRKEAWALLSPLRASVETALENKPPALVQYRQANALMEEQLPLLEVGSLAWQIEENGIANKGTDALVAFLKLPENADRLDEFFSAVGPVTAERLKARML